MVNLLSVAAGGAIGASARFLVGVAIGSQPDRFPWATLTVNLLGCFTAGALSAWLMTRGSLSANAVLFLSTGLLGGFTTFSAFSVESLRLAESGQTSLAAINIFTNLVGCLLAVTVGWLLARSLA
jgi:CrcB protein